MTQNSDRIGLVHYAVSPSGEVDQQFPAIFHRADQPLPLASTIKIVLLATYAREIEAGRVNPDEEVTLGDWQKHYHPVFEEHIESLESLAVATDELGFALDPSETVPLDALVSVMISNSDNAATDYLLQRFGTAGFEETVALAGMDQQDTLFSFVGLLLVFNNHEQGVISPDRLAEALALDAQSFRAEVERLESLYQDPEWKLAEIQWLLTSGAEWDDAAVAALLDAHYPRGTARSYARILGQVLTGNFLSPVVSEVMRRHLERDLEGSGVEDVLSLVGAKGGDSPGTLVLARYTVPLVGEYAGQPLVTVLMLNGLPPQIPVSSYLQAFEVLVLQLWLDGTFADQVAGTLCTPDAFTACVNHGRFRVELDLPSSLGGGPGHAAPASSAESAIFWMFSPDNWELLVKVLDGCTMNERFWVFSAAATDVAYKLTVTDTASGQVRTYENTAGIAAPAITDTAAFASCGSPSLFGGSQGETSHD